MFCTRCGTVNADQARFCAGCGSPLNPASARQAPAAAAPVLYQAKPVHYAYAGFWRRFVAMIIDGLVFTPLILIVVLTSGLFGIAMQPGADLESLAGAFFGIGVLALICLIFAGSWLYYTAMESSHYQATLGKKALGIIVTDMNGNRISFARANGRFFGKWISGMIMNIGYLMAAFTEKKQALHDILAGCLVVMK
jgi:uncharacterized RDD family membrane protein YckC